MKLRGHYRGYPAIRSFPSYPLKPRDSVMPALLCLAQRGRLSMPSIAKCHRVWQAKGTLPSRPRASLSGLAWWRPRQRLEEPGMNRPFLPFLRLARVAWLAPSLGLALAMAGSAAPPVTTGPIVTTTPMGAAAAAAAAATGAARKNAEALFSRYVDLEHAFDPALVDLYAPG